MQGLNLHSGGELITLDALASLPTPPATATHHPLPHIDLVKMAKFALQFYGHEVVEEAHAIDKDGDRYFGLLSLRSDYGNYTDTVGLRSSWDKTFPIGISIGAKVFVCSNLSFCGDHVIKRKNTLNAKRDLPGLVAEVIEPLRVERQVQAQRFIRYQETEIGDELADHAMMRFYREGVINLTRIADVNQQWHEPSHDWGEKTIWRLFNATTFALTGRIAENPAGTAQLHRILDGVCESIH